MTEGPHCPKCGSHSDWAEYAGGDALQCRAEVLYTADPRDDSHFGPCAYIHWLRNAPAETLADRAAATAAALDAGRAQNEKWALQQRRKRVRKLVHSLLLSPRQTIYHNDRGPNPINVIDIAMRIDADIEAIGVTKDES